MRPRRSTAAFAFIAAAVLSCASCVVQPAPRPVAAAPPPSSPVSSFCREFTAPVTINGELTDATGEACLQPDGTWQVAENAPGVPQPQVFAVPPPPANYVTYPYPWWGTPNIRVGGRITFGSRGHPGRWRGDWHRRRF